MVAKNFDANAISSVTLNSCNEKDHMVAYNFIMKCLKDRNMLVDPHILDNEASKDYKKIIKDQWKSSTS